jgi:hypothetical protein
MTTTCGDGQVACNTAGADSTFTVPNAKGTAVFFATAQDAAGNSGTSGTLTFTLTTSSNPNPNPGSGTITISVDMNTDSYAASRVVVPHATVTTTKGSVNKVMLLWTDGRGQLTSYPMCPAGANAWQLPIQLALRTGPRSFQIQAGDSAGDSGTSGAATFDVQ